MNNLDLKGRLPEDLATQQICEDILLELKDTHKFKINWLNLDRGGWRANGKAFDNWVERGQVVMHEVDNSTLPKTWSEPFVQSTIGFVEKRYDIFRHPIRLLVEFISTDYRRHYHQVERGQETYQLVSDVYQRLKDYIGPDVIQDQFSHNFNFQIDFIISSTKLVKNPL